MLNRLCKNGLNDQNKNVKFENQAKRGNKYPHGLQSCVTLTCRRQRDVCLQWRGAVYYEMMKQTRVTFIGALQTHATQETSEEPKTNRQMQQVSQSCAVAKSGKWWATVPLAKVQLCDYENQTFDLRFKILA